MRSSRSGPDPLDPGRNGFAHRGLHRAPAIVENTLVSFAASLELGAGIECDLRLTADDHILVFHDADAARLCGSPDIIGQSTRADLSHLTVGGQPLPTLAQLLTLVAGRAPMLLEVKIHGDMWRFGRALVAALDGYFGPYGVMSFDPRLLRWFKTNAPHMRRGLVIRDSLSSLKRWGAMKLADPAFLAVDVAAIERPWVAAARAKMPVYTWTVRTGDDRRRALLCADALIWEADGRP
ncbi:glycerophosphodiester phosphodiesterase family protein [Sphingomonas sp.]|uniref:glycerophosphodiester phosphodiesterase family protein n=1 Tax=Sphingomonas sp. TaxID=28214 RepID=UPI00286BEAE0|nr:glycerophosphodiester phosphodiesterase family protein [Sphingomonas sp.]